MGYPGAYKNTFLINSAAAAVPPNSGSFRKIVATGAGTVTVKGHNIYVYVDVSTVTTDAAADNYIDPTTGAPFASNALLTAADDGYYELSSSEATNITLVANQAVEGEFLSVQAGTATGVTAYT
jgi:hypothetical protein